MPRVHPPAGYSSSQDKDLIRKRFDRPLIERIHTMKAQPLNYFGLPGAEALELKEWGDLLGHVEAVERDESNLEALETLLDTQYPNIRYRTHLDDVDRVIIQGASRRTPKRGRPFWHWVTSVSDPDFGHYWNFDVVYLDYFGKFLPFDRGTNYVRRRANALRKIFDTDREDGWQSWMFLITVELRLFVPWDRRQMRDYLSSFEAHAAEEEERILNFLMETGLTPRSEAVRLIHGTLAYMLATAASNYDVRIRPRGAVIYRGSHNTPMVHMAYQVDPASTLVGPQEALSLLQAPILEPLNPAGQPWFRISSDQPPGVTSERFKEALDFLEENQSIAILNAGS